MIDKVIDGVVGLEAHREPIMGEPDLFPIDEKVYPYKGILLQNGTAHNS